MMPDSQLDELNAVQREYENFSGTAREFIALNDKLEFVRPKSYIQVHATGLCRVVREGRYIHMLTAVTEQDALTFCRNEQIQTEIRFHINENRWVLTEGGAE